MNKDEDQEPAFLDALFELPEPDPSAHRERYGPISGKPREKDIVWDELETIFGPVTNLAGRARRNAATKLIKQSLAFMAEREPDRFPRDDEAVKREIRARYGRLVLAWPSVKPTATFLSSKWDDAAPVPSKVEAYHPRTEPPSIPREDALELLREWKEQHP